jgi:hypothetical protein
MKYLLIYPIGMVLTMALWRFVPGFEKFIKKTIYDATPVAITLYWPFILLCMICFYIMKVILSSIGFLITGRWDSRW